MISLLAVLCIGQYQDPRFDRLFMPWKPEADAPFYAIRAKIEPYAYRSDMDVNWMRRQAAEAFAAWQGSPQSPLELYRASLWHKVLVAAHYDSDRDEDQVCRQRLAQSLTELKRIPPSAEFARCVAWSLDGDSCLRNLSVRLLRKDPKDGLLLYWTRGNTIFAMQRDRDVRFLQMVARGFLARRPEYWPARYLWAVEPHLVGESVTMQDRLDGFREMQKRMLALRPGTQEGSNKRGEVDLWLKRLSRYIPAYEKVVKEGKGNLKVKGYRGDPP